MPRSLFDALPSTPDRPFSVSEIVGRLKALVETDYGDVTVEGELSNFSRARSGHCYFSVKDEEAQLRCVMWRHQARQVGFTPEDGMLVRLSGRISIYERRGALQLVADTMVLAGEGALQKAFEKLKRRLEGEGLFDKKHKQPLPPFPETIGLVTSGESAALQDILTVLKRRFPSAAVQLRHVSVQGMEAGAQIAAAIEAFSDGAAETRPDLLIVGRGGGSAEDLWAFNEEVVARALFACPIPVISAVGHETDVSISDFVADRRAATPSMGAEVAVPDRRELETTVRALHTSLENAVDHQIEQGRQRVDYLLRSRGLNRPVDRLPQLRQRLDELVRRLERAGPRLVHHHRDRLEALRRRLRALDPQAPLRRGYAFVEKDGLPVRTAGALTGNDRVTLRFADGHHPARIEEE